MFPYSLIGEVIAAGVIMGLTYTLVSILTSRRVEKILTDSTHRVKMNKNDGFYYYLSDGVVHKYHPDFHLHQRLDLPEVIELNRLENDVRVRFVGGSEAIIDVDERYYLLDNIDQEISIKLEDLNDHLPELISEVNRANLIIIYESERDQRLFLTNELTRGISGEISHTNNLYQHNISLRSQGLDILQYSAIVVRTDDCVIRPLCIPLVNTLIDMGVKIIIPRQNLYDGKDVNWIDGRILAIKLL